MFLVTYFKRGLWEDARAVARNWSSLRRAARASVPRSLRCYQMGQVFLFSLTPLPLFSWCGSMTALKEKKNNLTWGNECKWMLMPYGSPSTPPAAIVISFSYLGWVSVHILAIVGKEQRSSSSLCLCLYSDPYILDLIPGSAWNSSQAATEKVLAMLMPCLYVVSHMKECEMLPGVNFQAAVEHLTVWLPLELMEPQTPTLTAKCVL